MAAPSRKHQQQRYNRAPCFTRQHDPTRCLLRSKCGRKEPCTCFLRPKIIMNLFAPCATPKRCPKLYIVCEKMSGTWALPLSHEPWRADRGLTTLCVMPNKLDNDADLPSSRAVPLGCVLFFSSVPSTALASRLRLYL